MMLTVSLPLTFKFKIHRLSGNFTSCIINDNTRTAYSHKSTHTISSYLINSNNNIYIMSSFLQLATILLVIT